MTLNGKWLALICGFTFAVNSYAFAQSDSTFLTHAVNKLTNQPAIEKVYLHLDKPSGYFFGDTIWYKAYTVIGTHHQLSALSGVLYIELISPKDSVVSRQTLHLLSGTAWGDIPLPRTLKQGSYSIRAYTNWMRNTPDYFYDQQIRIGGMAPVLEKPGIAKNPDVQFFPEGGQLVNGVRSRIAVKSTGTNGLGEDIKGTIEDNEGNVVADFTTQHLGMGVFALIPQNGKTYKAKINIPGETAFTVDLPKALPEGYTIAVNNNEKDSLYIKVAVNDKVLNQQKNSTFYILAQNNEKVYYTSQGKIENLVYSAKVEKSRFPTGITQFTLFSQSGEPLAERIAFIQSADSIKLNIKSANQSYTTRQKVKIDLNTKDNSNQPTTGSFSVAVINESRTGADENSESTILNNLLLASDLKGYIEQPNYYFTGNNQQQRQVDLDILMLTQGYRRFEWKQVLSNNQPIPIYQPERSLEIAGTLKTPAGKPVPNGKITLLATREKFMSDTTTDINGNFKFTNVDLSDTAKTILRARKEHNGSNVAIFVKQPDYPAVTHSNNIGLNSNQVMLTTAQTTEFNKNYAEYQKQLKEDSLKGGKQLKGVTIKGKKTPKPSESNLYGTDLPYTISGARLRKYGNLMQALQVTLPSVHYNNGQFLSGAGYPHYLVINNRVADQSELNNYSPDEIEDVKVLVGGAYKTFFGIMADDGDSSGPGKDDIKKKRDIILVTTRQYAGTDTAKTINLKQVDIKSAKVNKKPVLTHSDNLNGPGNANQIIMGDKLDGCITLSDCLAGKVFGVAFGSDGTPYNTRGLRPQMVVIVDGMIMTGNHLNDLNANDIYSIEVLRSGSYLAIYGTNAGGGALVITTRRGGEPTEEGKYTTSEIPAGLINYPFKGYFKAKAFYSPKYSHAKTDSEPLDLRSTIYWNPNIITDKDGNASFEYFNADTKGTYRVVVEGIDDSGNLGRQVYRYKVE
jgi:hypothetical protein